MAFVKDHHSYIYGMDDLGGDMARKESDHVWKVLLDQATPIRFSDVEDLAAHIRELKGESNQWIILTSHEYLRDKGFILNSQFYVDRWQEPNHNEMDFGYFENVPLIATRSPILTNAFLVVNIPKSARLYTFQSNSLYQRQLGIRIEEISDQEALELYEDQPGSWNKSEHGKELNKEETLAKIKTSVKIKLSSKVLVELTKTKEIYDLKHETNNKTKQE